MELVRVWTMPFQTGEAREIRVERNDSSVVFDGQGGDMSVIDEVPASSSIVEEFPP